MCCNAFQRNKSLFFYFFAAGSAQVAGSARTSFLAMAAASSMHIPVRAATPDLIATYNIGATSGDYCMSKSKKPMFERKLKEDLTQLLKVCSNKRPLVGLRRHDKPACLLVLCFALLVSVLVLLCSICFTSLCLLCMACSLACVPN